MPFVSRIILKVLLLFSLATLAQTDNIAIGQWRVHLPLRNTKLVAEAGNTIYCAGESGMFAYSKTDNSLSVISKVQGLSDVSITALNYYSSRNTLVIGYENGNVDILVGSEVYNIADIKRKQISAKKLINKIYFRDNFAYLATGFGIVVLDLEKREVKDTYFIGLNGGYLNVYDFLSDNTYFYAGTENGLYRADLNSQNLSNYQVWSKILLSSSNTVNNSHINALQFFNGDLYANYGRFIATGQNNRDTIYRFNGTSWSRTKLGSHYGVRSLKSNPGNLLVNCDALIFTYPPDSNTRYTNYYLNQNSNAKDAVYDSEGNIWIADYGLGLIKWTIDNQYTSFAPQGPLSLSVAEMTSREGEMWIVPGGKDITWTPTYNNQGISILKNNEWVYFDRRFPIIDTVFDLISLSVNPNNSNQVFSASWGHGLAEFNSDGPVAAYGPAGTTIQNQQVAANYYNVRIGDTDYDRNENLWMSNSFAGNPLVVYTAEKTWDSFNFLTEANNPEVGNILATSGTQVWLQVRTTGIGGILVYDHKGTISDHSDDQYKHLNINVGEGALPSNEVLSMEEDKDGSIWVGTDKGVVVFYNPADIFAGQTFDAQSVLVNQDGHTQKLLETETVTSIVIDGANRKWFGTQNSGIYLMSGDATQQLEHFTEDNSPLISNTVITMAINAATGELFVATEKGIISYKGTSTEGVTRCEDTYAYPNPVRPGFSGLIAVKGLVTDAHVRITDISGNMVYETKAIGGQAVWDGKNFNGERVRSGVYIVFAANADASETCVTKILFVN